MLLRCGVTKSMAALSEASASFDWLSSSGDKRLIVLLLIRNGDSPSQNESCSSARRDTRWLRFRLKLRPRSLRPIGVKSKDPHSPVP